MKRNCDCLEQIRAHIVGKNEKGVETIGLDIHCSNIQSIDAKDFKDHSTGQPITTRVKFFLKDGVTARYKNRSSFLYHAFCPFCGAKYGEKS